MKKIGENLTIPRNYLRGISFPERTFFTLFPKPKDEDGPFHHKDFPSCVFMELLQSHLQRNPKASRVLRQSSIVFGRRELDRDRDQYQILFRRAGRLWPKERREGAVGRGRSVCRSAAPSPSPSPFLSSISLLRQTETVSDG